MHYLRTLVVLTAIAMTASTSTAASASAQTLEIATPAGAHCPEVTSNGDTEFPVESTVSGGCIMHMTNTEGAIVLAAHIFGIESIDLQCNNELTVRIDEDGNAYLTNIHVGGTAGCTRRPCGTASGVPLAWEAHAIELDGMFRLEMHFCLENLDGGGRQTCHLFIPFVGIGSNRYEFGTVNASDTRTEIGCEGFTGFRAEVLGHWTTEAGTPLVVTHTP